MLVGARRTTNLKTTILISCAKHRYVSRCGHLHRRIVTVLIYGGVFLGIASILVSMPIHTYWKAALTNLKAWIDWIFCTIKRKTQETISQLWKMAVSSVQFAGLTAPGLLHHGI